MQIYLAILAIVITLAGGVTTCNYVERTKARADTAAALAETSALETKQAKEGKQAAEANLKAAEDNAAKAAQLQADAEAKSHALDVQFIKTKEALNALKNRKPVSKECAAACRNNFAPVARIIAGMRDADAAGAGSADGDQVTPAAEGGGKD